MADVAQTFALNPYAAEQAKNERLQRYAELLQSQGLAPNEKFSYNGIEAPPSAAGALAKGLQLGVSGYLQGRGMRNSEDLANKMTTERKADMDKIVSALQGTLGAAEVPGSVTATQADVNDREMGPAAANPIALGQQLATGGGMGEGANIGAPAKAAVPGSLEAAQSMMMASKFPDLQAAGLSGMAARQAAKDARLLTLEDAETKFKNEQKLKLSPGYRNPVPGVDVPFSSDVLGQNIAIAAAKMPPPANYEPTGVGSGVRPIEGGPADPKVIAATARARRLDELKPIPANINTGISENLQAVRKIDNALNALDPKKGGDPNATGFKNLIPDSILNRLDPTGTSARGLIADIGSLKIHDRSGAAVTAAETPRLKPFIPSATDDLPTIKTKLANFRNEYFQMLNDFSETYGAEQGYKPNPVLDQFLRQGTLPEGAPAAAAPSMDEIQAEIARRGLNK